jgi:hypothetical protein
MESKYEIHEVLPDGSAVPRMAVSDHEEAIRKATELAAHSSHEVHVIDAPTKSLVAVADRRIGTA